MVSGSKIALEVYFYAETSGREPVKDWLKKLDAKAKRTIGQDIKTVQIGWPIGMPVVRSLGGGLWEIRSKLDNRVARILFVMHKRTIVLVHGFIKKTQKTPKADLEIAKKRAKNITGG